jgi:Probable N6-adenine methyltransferase
LVKVDEVSWPLTLSQAACKPEENPKIYLLEFDERFSVFPEFIHYDFRDPLKLPCEHEMFPRGRTGTDCPPASMKSAIDHIICDPPFLSEDCQTKG